MENDAVCNSIQSLFLLQVERILLSNAHSDIAHRLDFVESDIRKRLKDCKKSTCHNLDMPVAGDSWIFQICQFLSVELV